ncbi:hypothetical protein PIB30_057209 [Stylosanthes scabra]|uniref:Uncharacterized protein n=1 Tax=Stylosanthes scabra TaxID=79078 RepID=A0ABU6WJ75_9FABA|nr:hypothetical protein [Stylosanthes scabra]
MDFEDPIGEWGVTIDGRVFVSDHGRLPRKISHRPSCYVSASALAGFATKGVFAGKASSGSGTPFRRGLRSRFQMSRNGSEFHILFSRSSTACGVSAHE